MEPFVVLALALLSLGGQISNYGISEEQLKENPHLRDIRLRRDVKTQLNALGNKDYAEEEIAFETKNTKQKTNEDIEATIELNGIENKNYSFDANENVNTLKVNDDSKREDDFETNNIKKEKNLNAEADIELYDLRNKNYGLDADANVNALERDDKSIFDKDKFDNRFSLLKDASYEMNIQSKSDNLKDNYDKINDGKISVKSFLKGDKVIRKRGIRDSLKKMSNNQNKHAKDNLIDEDSFRKRFFEKNMGNFNPDFLNDIDKSHPFKNENNLAKNNGEFITRNLENPERTVYTQQSDDVYRYSDRNLEGVAFVNTNVNIIKPKRNRTVIFKSRPGLNVTIISDVPAESTVDKNNGYVINNRDNMNNVQPITNEQRTSKPSGVAINGGYSKVNYNNVETTVKSYINSNDRYNNEGRESSTIRKSYNSPNYGSSNGSDSRINRFGSSGNGYGTNTQYGSSNNGFVSSTTRYGLTNNGNGSPNAHIDPLYNGWSPQRYNYGTNVNLNASPNMRYGSGSPNIRYESTDNTYVSSDRLYGSANNNQGSTNTRYGSPDYASPNTNYRATQNNYGSPHNGYGSTNNEYRKTYDYASNTRPRSSNGRSYNNFNSNTNYEYTTPKNWLYTAQESRNKEQAVLTDFVPTPSVLIGEYHYIQKRSYNSAYQQMKSQMAAAGNQINAINNAYGTKYNNPYSGISSNNTGRYNKSYNYETTRYEGVNTVTEAYSGYNRNNNGYNVNTNGYNSNNNGYNVNNNRYNGYNSPNNGYNINNNEFNGYNVNNNGYNVNNNGYNANNSGFNGYNKIYSQGTYNHTLVNGATKNNTNFIFNTPNNGYGSFNNFNNSQYPSYNNNNHGYNMNNNISNAYNPNNNLYNPFRPNNNTYTNGNNTYNGINWSGNGTYTLARYNNTITTTTPKINQAQIIASIGCPDFMQNISLFGTKLCIPKDDVEDVDDDYI